AAARIHIEEGKDRGLARSVVADGRAVEGRAYELDSLSVGENRAAKVLVVALPGAGSERDGVDGLLGMSFLGRFSVELDAEAGRLVLSRLRAPARAQTR
ncbi:MAG TPA: aspartyl protease family protein, partial [Elusimicrobiota bacterium]|nr:aspartyl protease family protein [Elusimicrobiota bacterium]